MTIVPVLKRNPPPLPYVTQGTKPKLAGCSMKVLNLYNPPPFHPLAYVPPPPPHIATQYCQYTDKKRKQNYPHILGNSDGIGCNVIYEEGLPNK
jgi:hypothetical protein